MARSQAGEKTSDGKLSMDKPLAGSRLGGRHMLARYPRKLEKRADEAGGDCEANSTPMTGRAYEAMVKHRGRFQLSVSVLPSGTAFSLIFPGAGTRMRML